MNQKIKISQLPAKGSNLAAQDLLEIAEFTGTGYISKSITGQELIDAIPAPTGFVPDSRTLTINGTTQDLSADRTFTISTGITIGTTAIASGVVGRVLFEGAGNVVQESSSLFWDNTNARLGVGTSSPAYGLDVVHSVASLTARFSSPRGLLLVDSSTNTQNSAVQLSAKTSIGATVSAGFYQIPVGTTDSLFSISGNATDLHMSVFRNGNVAINTTTDAGFRLDVNGTARVQGALRMATEVWNGFGTYGMASFSGSLYFKTNGIMSFQTSNGIDRILMFSSGNVGINTTTDAGFRLDVNGTARVNGNLTFQTTSWILDNSNAIMHRGGFNVESIAFNLSRMVFTDNNGFVFNGNNSAATLTASSIVDIQSTTKGFLPPRMTTTQKNAIASPAAGLLVYDTTLNVISYYNGTMWI